MLEAKTARSVEDKRILQTAALHSARLKTCDSKFNPSLMIETQEEKIGKVASSNASKPAAIRVQGRE